MDLTLHRDDYAPFYWVGDTLFYLTRVVDGRWAIAGTTDTHQWRQAHDLDAARFEKRSQALEYLQALFAVDPPPMEHALPTRLLRAHPEGGYSISTPWGGEYRARRHAHGWRATRTDRPGNPVEAGTLWWLRVYLSGPPANEKGARVEMPFNPRRP